MYDLKRLLYNLETARTPKQAAEPLQEILSQLKRGTIGERELVLEVTKLNSTKVERILTRGLFLTKNPRIGDIYKYSAKLPQIQLAAKNAGTDLLKKVTGQNPIIVDDRSDYGVHLTFQPLPSEEGFKTWYLGLGTWIGKEGPILGITYGASAKRWGDATMYPSDLNLVFWSVFPLGIMKQLKELVDSERVEDLKRTFRPIQIF